VGKTTIAETLSRVVAEDAVWIPYAIEVDGQIITVYDPAIHKRRSGSGAGDPGRALGAVRAPGGSGRGELTIEMLDLQFNPVTKFYVPRYR